MVTGIERIPAVKVACAVYQRCPAAPAIAPIGSYVYQAANSAPESGLTSTVKPWPDVVGSYQFPEWAKSVLVGNGVVVAQVTFCVRRVNGMFPVRPEPSVKLYESCPLVHVAKLSVAVPTACAMVVGNALKLPPVFW